MNKRIRDQASPEPPGQNMVAAYLEASQGAERPTQFAGRIEDCGCGVEGLPLRIIFCPLHAAAPELLAALKIVRDELYALVILPGPLDFMTALGASNPADNNCLKTA